MEAQKQYLTQSIESTRINNAISLKKKEVNLTYLSNQSENLTKEYNVKIEVHREIIIETDDIKNNISNVNQS